MLCTVKSKQTVHFLYMCDDGDAATTVHTITFYEVSSFPLVFFLNEKSKKNKNKNKNPIFKRKLIQKKKEVKRFALAFTDEPRGRCHFLGLQ